MSDLVSRYGDPDPTSRTHKALNYTPPSEKEECSEEECSKGWGVTEWETVALDAGEIAAEAEQLIKEGVGKWVWYSLAVRAVAFIFRKLRR